MLVWGSLGSSRGGDGRSGALFPSILLVGPEWPCVLVTAGLITGITGAWLAAVAFPYSTAAGAVGCVSGSAVLAAFLVAALSDPGIVPRKARLARDEEAGDNPLGHIPCNKCNVFREPGTIHCTICGVCVRGLDHHCGWLGKCVGQHTMPYFKGFLALIISHMFFVISITAVGSTT